MRRIREQSILVATSDHLIADICDVIETCPIDCVLWLGPTFLMPAPSLISAANMLRQRGGYQIVTAGNSPLSVASILKTFGPEVDALYQDGLIDIAESQTVEGIPDHEGKMTWVFSHPMSPDDMVYQDRHALFHSDGFALQRVENRWYVECSRDGFWVIQGDHAPVPFYRETLITARVMEAIA